MQELYSGLLGGRKFHYQIKLAINHGLDILQDPMLSSMVHALQLANFQSIKKKARVFVPESCTLIGVVDETGLLEANEIFVQIKRDSFSCRTRRSAADQDASQPILGGNQRFFADDSGEA